MNYPFNTPDAPCWNCGADSTGGEFQEAWGPYSTGGEFCEAWGPRVWYARICADCARREP